MNIRKLLFLKWRVHWYRNVGFPYRLQTSRIETLNLLPNITSCTFVHLLHTNQKDLVKMYEPWYLGSPTPGATLASRDLFKRVERFAWDDINRDRSRLTPDREIHFLVIHGRKKEPVTIKEMKRQHEDTRSQGYHDFFG